MPQSNFQRMSRRQRQFRLMFDPVEPGTQSPMSPARIRYADPDGKTQEKVRRQTTTSNDNNAPDGAATAEPAIMKSSSRAKETGAEALPSPQKSSPPSALGTAELLESDSDNSDGESDIQITSSRRMPAQVKNEKPVRSKRITRKSMDGVMDDSDSSEGSEPEEENEKRRRVRPKRSRKKKAAVYIEEDSDDGEESLQAYTSREKGGRKSQFTPVKSRSFLSGGSSYNAPIASTRRGLSFSSHSRGTQKFETKRSIPSKSKEPVDSTSDDDELEVTILTPKVTQASSQRSKQLPSSTRSRQQKRTTIDMDSGEDEGSSDDSLPSLSTLSGSKKQTPEISKLSLQTSKELEEEDDSDDDIVSSPSKRKRLVMKAPYIDDDEDEDNDIVPSPSKRKRATEDSDDSDDLEIIPDPKLDEGSDDDDAVFSSPAKKRKTYHQNLTAAAKSLSRITRQQQLKKSKRTTAQKQMELLRRKRAGENIDKLTDSDEDEEHPALYDSGSELKALSDFEDEDEDEAENENAKVKKSPHKVKNKKDEDGDDVNDDNFVVEDDDEEIGAPGLHDIPLEFTHAAHKSKKEHFKDVIEWLVQRKINPAFNRQDPVYIAAFRKLDDQLTGQALSNFTSSVWRQGFTRALYARPVLIEEFITGYDELNNKCDACNRTNHPAKYMISFTGKAYYKDSLEDVDNDPDSGGEDEHQDYNENEEPIPAEDVEYRVGRTCKSNAEMAHSLIHWRYALNEWVLSQLKVEGHLNPEKLAVREELNIKKRSQIAEGIVDKWEEDNKLKGLYSQLKLKLQSAQHDTKNSRWGR